jgi:hypothetical protein
MEMKRMKNHSTGFRRVWWVVLILFGMTSQAQATVSFVVRPQETATPERREEPQLPVQAAAGFPTGMSNQQPASGQEEVQEVQQVVDPQAELARKLNAFNALNVDVTAIPPGTGLPGIFGPDTALGKILADPRVQKFQKLILDTEFQKILGQLMKSPDLKRLPWYELGWILVVFLYSSWKSAAITGFFRVILFRMGVSAVLVSGSGLVIPWLVVGDSYLRLITLLWQVI